MALRILPELDRRRPKTGTAAPGQYDSITAHLLRRMGDAIEHHWTVERDDWIVLLRFLYSDRPELRPRDGDDL